MLRTIHMIGSMLATISIATFFTATVLVELFASHETIAMVKGYIVSPGLFVLVPAIAITGATGFKLSKTRKGRLVQAKQKRMPIIAANGLLILLPSAIFLEQWATAGLFDNRFYIVQGLELVAGFTNLSLMSLNIRDGLKLSGLHKRQKTNI